MCESVRTDSETNVQDTASHIGHTGILGVVTWFGSRSQPRRFPTIERPILQTITDPNVDPVAYKEEAQAVIDAEDLIGMHLPE